MVQLERRIPATVARVQLGAAIRPARACNVDLPLISAVKSKHPELMDDYPKPMLRVDLVDPARAAQASLYFPPLMRGSTIAREVAERRLPASGVAVCEETVMETTRALEACPPPPPSSLLMPLPASLLYTHSLPP